MGDILEGEIVRIEKYGAFCSLMIPNSLGTGGRRPQPYRPPQGLIHISQLHSGRVERVEDIVSLQDHVWVKVLEVERGGDDTNTTKLRIKLSMKDASQDGTRQDLGRQREQVENAKTQLETNLNSMIGMGVTRDPMKNLVIKSQRSGVTSNSSMTFRGGYSLVDDDEGEPDQPSTDIVSSQRDGLGSVNRQMTNPGLALAPMGRGRGATLPAWMTSQQSAGRNEGPTGNANAPGSNASSNSSGDESEDGEGRKRRKRRKSRKHDSKHASKRKSKRHHRRHDHRRYDSDSENDVSSRRERRAHGKERDDNHRHDVRKKKRRRSLSVRSGSGSSVESRELRDCPKSKHEKEDDTRKRKRRRSRSRS